MTSLFDRRRVGAHHGQRWRVDAGCKRLAAWSLLVLADVDRYTGQKIELASEATGDLRFTGTLNLKSSAAWLRGLSVALPVVVTQEENGVLVVKQKLSRH